MNVPNIITIFRILLVPVMFFALASEKYRLALTVFLVASVSDGLDGFLARYLNQRTRLGAILDPLADKLLVVVVVLMLTVLHRLPLWLAAVIILRDLFIVGGALIYHSWVAPVEMKPTFVSKVNTVVQFVMLILVLVQAARLAQLENVLHFVFILVFASTFLSGIDYVWHWGRRAYALKRKGDA